MTELALRTTIVFASAFVAAAALRRATPATRHLLWHTTMIVVVAAPLLQPLMPRIAVPTFLAPATMSASFGTADRLRQGSGESRRSRAKAEAVPYVTEVPYATNVGRRFSGAEPAAAIPEEPETNADPLGLSLTMLWLAGSVVTGAWLVFGWLASLWIAGRASRAPGGLELEARSVARSLGLKRIPDIGLMEHPRGPLTVGIFRPSILLPSVALDWAADRRRAVFAHELAHVRRADTRTQALAHVACALYWFNPLAWMAAHALRRERERACDDVVIAMGIRPSSYAQDLLEIAQGSSTRFSPSAALAMARPTELEGRLLSLLSSDRRREPLRATKWVVTLSMALSATLVLSAQPAGSAARGTTPIAVDRPPMAAVWREMSRAGDEAATSDVEAIAPLVAALDDPSSQVRETAAIGLALRSAPAVIEPLLRALQDADAQVREKAAMGLSLRRDPRVVDALLVAITDVDGQVREKAAMGLSLRRDPRVVDALLVAIADVDSQVREKAAIALGTSGDPRAVTALRTATNDPAQQVREKAALGLVLLR